MYHSPECTLVLEHSLVAVAKWEAKYKKPFMSGNEKANLSDDELIYYIKCMTITQGVDPLVYLSLTEENYQAINDYIADPMTATTIHDEVNDNKGTRYGKPKATPVSSEQIYSFMIRHGMEKSYEKWNLNRLMTLIRLIKIDEDRANGNGKMSKAASAQRQAELNKARRAASAKAKH